MTERMENTLRHIKTSVDVDPWAVNEVERVFKAVEDIKAEIKEIRDSWELDCYHDEADALTLAIKIINKHISGEEQGKEANE